MLKRALILAASLLALASASASADARAHPGGGPGPGGDACYGIGVDYIECYHTPDCKWDIEDARCEPISGGYCEHFGGSLDCNADAQCIWDTREDRCEHI